MKIKNETIAQNFLTYCSKHYELLHSEFKHQMFTQGHFKRDYSYDLLNDVILKVHKTISKNGIKQPSDQTFKNYLFRAYKNEFLQYQDRTKKSRVKDIPDQLDNITIEHDFDDQFTIRADDAIVDIIYDYVEANYSAIDEGLFKMYFKNLIRYKEISELTNW